MTVEQRGPRRRRIPSATWEPFGYWTAPIFVALVIGGFVLFGLLVGFTV